MSLTSFFLGEMPLAAQIRQKEEVIKNRMEMLRLKREERAKIEGRMQQIG